VTLEDLGWNARFAKEFAPHLEKGWKPARLIRDNKISYGALTGDGDEIVVVTSGKILHDAKTDAELPTVGDWVAVEDGNGDQGNVIRARLARQSWLSRKMPGRSTEEQVMVSNIQVVVVVTDAGTDFNLRRMERYFEIIRRGAARPVVLVNKADLFPDARNRKTADSIRALNPAAEVHITSVAKKHSLTALTPHLKRGNTITFVGSSGVGKSSVINHLLGGDYQWTDEVNGNTGKGRHTTTARELMVLRKGGIIIDNPGIREVHMWTDERTLTEGFADIELLATHCKFADCQHGPHTGCAVRAALDSGKLNAARFEGFLKLGAEIAKLRESRRKRQVTADRHTRRREQGQSRKFAARRDRRLDHEF